MTFHILSVLYLHSNFSAIYLNQPNLKPKTKKIILPIKANFSPVFIRLNSNGTNNK